MASNAGDTNPDPNSEEGGGPAHNTDASLLGQALDPPLLALAFFEHLLTAHAQSSSAPDIPATDRVPVT